MYAARDGHEHIVRELLDAGADSERRDVVCYLYLVLFISSVNTQQVSLLCMIPQIRSPI